MASAMAMKTGRAKMSSEIRRPGFSSSLFFMLFSFLGRGLLLRSRFHLLSEKLLIDRVAESFVSHLQTHGIGRFCVCASHIAELFLSVGGGYVNHLGDLTGRRIGLHLPGIGDFAHNSVNQLVISRVATRIERAGEEICFHSSGRYGFHA